MPTIEIITIIAAPRKLVFDLCRDVSLHVASSHDTGERAVDGKISGYLELNDEVTWEARHFGIIQRLRVRITAFNSPAYFRDGMIFGAFSRFDHDHYFEQLNETMTRMRDVFDYTSPFGLIGQIADAVFLKAYMTRFIKQRTAFIKNMAEARCRLI